MRHDACVATRVRGDQSEDVLDVRMLCLERRRRELGEVVDLLAHADAAGVGAAVDVATALPPVADCADVATLTAPLPLPRDPALRAAVEGLHAEIARVDALRITRQLEPGLAAARALVEHARNVAYPPVQAEAIYYGALMHGMASQLDDAERLAEEALYLAIAARHTGVVVRAANELIWDLGIAGERRDEAERWARLASAALASLGGDDELEALLESTLGTLALYESKNDDALAHLERALALERELAGDDSPHVGRSLANLAILYFNRGDLAKSGELLREAHAIYVRTYGDDSPTLIEIEQNLAVLEVELGELDAAAAHATHAYELAVATYGELSAEAAAGLAPLISVHELQGDLVRAEGEARRRIAALEHVHGPDAGIVGSALVALADVEADRGALDAALADNQRALDLFARAFGRDGEDGRDAGLAWVARSVILVRARRPGEAVDAAARGHRIARRLVGDDSTVTGDALVKLGVAEVLAGRRRDGLAHLADGVAVLTRLGAPAPQRGEAEQALASALWVDDPAGARAHAARARDAFRDAGASAAHDLAEVEAWLAAHPP
ncbi:MAG: tetratricopeptide repeat protein [Kofleriaceae bacterium]|nr:tetratricopeptide repeat protein [Kofleriaceae bacterium]